MFHQIFLKYFCGLRDIRQNVGLSEVGGVKCLPPNGVICVLRYHLDRRDVTSEGYQTEQGSVYTRQYGEPHHNPQLTSDGGSHSGKLNPFMS